MRTKSKSWSAGWCMVVALGAAQAQAAGNCKIGKYAEIPVTMFGTRPLVEATLNGKRALLLADSGAFFSMLSRESAEKFDLKLGPLPMGFPRIQGAGGVDIGARRAVVKDFTLIGFRDGNVIHNVDFIVSGTNAWAGNIAGLIGENVLGGADTEYDLAHGVIRLLRADDCQGRPLAYWAGAASVAAVSIDRRTAAKPNIIGPATLNGKKIRVVFDTGAAHSVLTLKAAARAGIKPENDNVKFVGVGGGIGNKSLEQFLARFEMLDLGGEQIKNAQLALADIDLNGEADMLLGSDFFLSHRVYVASKQHKLYFTYNGGRVFDLGAPEPKPAEGAATADASEPAANAAASSDAPTDAAGFRRRGAAFAGRRDFVKAIADFDQAIKLDGNDAENYFQRGLAHEQNSEARLALADFDEVLKKDPKHVAALMERGTLKLVAAHDLQGARVDFDAATRSAPSDSTLDLRIASTYFRAQRFNEAITHADRWIDANPKDDRMASALALRCFSRAITNRELELALKDCNAAVKLPQRNSQTYESRALVWLRKGELDKSIADYKAALKLQPRAAFSLYGLGLAELKQGKKTAGEKDMQAALAIAPTIANTYRRAGLAP